MKKTILGLMAPLLLSAIAVSASGQTITGVLLNNSSSPPAWSSWNSIYGSNLYVGSGVSVRFTYPCTMGGECITSAGRNSHRRHRIRPIGMTAQLK
jgi:hypothetical protein